MEEKISQNVQNRPEDTSFSFNELAQKSYSFSYSSQTSIASSVSLARCRLIRCAAVEEFCPVAPRRLEQAYKSQIPENLEWTSRYTA
ncbi:hypothetical protein NECAME_15488 [Necator americanus]|uniref:Uncharacterized protein n=1 Tax=Necator americanus TaxID=51031 RepID=W2SJW4_NECAM|nr:hypothetical protein NECAME_15488 [Necator americanus]ETN69166.1 hypothetical protein NECAME_15488 [Necator americanus]